MHRRKPAGSRSAGATAGRPSGRGSQSPGGADPLRRRRRCRRPYESGDHAPAWSVARRELCREAGAGGGGRVSGPHQSRSAGGWEGGGRRAIAGRVAVPGRAVSRGARRGWEEAPARSRRKAGRGPGPGAAGGGPLLPWVLNEVVGGRGVCGHLDPLSECRCFSRGSLSPFW